MLVSLSYHFFLFFKKNLLARPIGSPSAHSISTPACGRPPPLLLQYCCACSIPISSPLFSLALLQTSWLCLMSHLVSPTRVAAALLVENVVSYNRRPLT